MKDLGILDGMIKIKIYTGPIYKVYADDFTLVRNRPVCTKKETKVKKYANFYIDEGTTGDYTNIEYGCVLPSREEAIKKCDQSVAEKKATLMSVLSGRITDPKEEHRILVSVSMDSEVLYYNKDELKYESTTTKKKLKELIKKADADRNKNKK